LARTERATKCRKEGSIGEASSPQIGRGETIPPLPRRARKAPPVDGVYQFPHRMALRRVGETEHTSISYWRATIYTCLYCDTKNRDYRTRSMRQGSHEARNRRGSDGIADVEKRLCAPPLPFLCAARSLSLFHVRRLRIPPTTVMSSLRSLQIIEICRGLQREAGARFPEQRQNMENRRWEPHP